MYLILTHGNFSICEPPTRSYIPSPSISEVSKMQDYTKGKSSNQNKRIKSNIVNYTDTMISAFSTTIAIKIKHCTY